MITKRQIVIDLVEPATEADWEQFRKLCTITIASHALERIQNKDLEGARECLHHVFDVDDLYGLANAARVLANLCERVYCGLE